ncbi:tRNA lysidine(34) synthetase TilS [Aestuariimicrobium kwangyangense]|uniref:tRNA lysidine(34) synthetase TilS n=1 Tax=Aestuariimicrobium kwangyangense TaxID=396389 RepID=UPI000424082F|nr:tRNA lysidine(34) synthetase TilS [Aestuariimicrobium kwangyangense]
MAARDLTAAQLAVVRAVRPPLGREAGAREAGGRVVLAVSGGADSLAMAAAVGWEMASRTRRRAALPRVAAVVVDHGLQEGSDLVAEATVAALAGLGLPARALRGSVRPDSSGGPESVARDLRLRLLAEAAGGAPVWLAHTRDDVAEQVLLGLARGSGARSLAGIPPDQTWSEGDERGLRMVRPLLGVARAETRQACTDWGLSPWDDPHNDDPKFLRSRVRRRVMPVLEAELGPGVAAALARTADLLREDADLLDSLTGEWLAEATDGDDLVVSSLVGVPIARATRVIRAWLVGRGVTPSREQVLAVHDLVVDWHGQAGVDLPGASVRRRGGASGPAALVIVRP